MTPITTTLTALHPECRYYIEWSKLLNCLGKKAPDDEPLPLLSVLDNIGLDDVLACLRASPEHNALWRLYAVDCARLVQHLMADPRSIAAVDTAERHAFELASDEELVGSRRDALAAADDARSAWLAQSAWSASAACSTFAADAAAASAARSAAAGANWTPAAARKATACNGTRAVHSTLLRRYLSGEITLASRRAEYDARITT